MSPTGRFPAATFKLLGAVVEDSARLGWDEAEEHQYETQVRVHSWLRPLVLSRFHRRDLQSQQYPLPLKAMSAWLASQEIHLFLAVYLQSLTMTASCLLGKEVGK